MVLIQEYIPVTKCDKTSGRDGKVEGVFFF
jgi:hypothetical protein